MWRFSTALSVSFIASSSVFLPQRIPSSLKTVYSLVPLQLRLRIFPDGGVSTGLETVEDETLFGVLCGSVAGSELKNALDFSSDDDGSTITDLLEAGVLVIIVDVGVADDATEHVDWSMKCSRKDFLIGREENFES
jgi:hypothetical protein